MNPKVEEIKASLQNPANMENPNLLSELIVKLSLVAYDVGLECAKSRLNQERSAASYMDAVLEGKKMSKAEAETRAIVDTLNDYEVNKNMYEGIIEIINALKKRIEVLSWEYRQH